MKAIRREWRELGKGWEGRENRGGERGGERVLFQALDFGAV